MRIRRGLVFLLFVVAVQAAPPALAQQPTLDVQLEAPEEVREVLERHVRLLRSEAVVLPEAAADRSALARRARREMAQLLATEGYFSPRIRIDRSTPGRWVLEVEPGRTLAYRWDHSHEDPAFDLTEALRALLGEALLVGLTLAPEEGASR